MAKVVWVSSIAGVLLIVTGALLFHFVPIFIQSRAKADMVLATPTAMMYKAFQNTSAVTDVYYNYFMFNLTNEADVLNGAEPILNEVGPYIYRLLQFKNASSIKWHPNATIEYTYHQIYVFDQELSGSLKESDLIITPNLGWVGALTQLNKIPANLFPDLFPKWGTAWNLVANASARANATWFMPLSVKEIIWGYDNALLASLAEISGLPLSSHVALDTNDDPFTAENPSAQWTAGDAAYNEPPSSPHPDMTMWAGNKGVLIHGEIFGVPEYYWGDNYSSMINGTNGEIYTPGIKEDDRPYVFVDNLFRSVILESAGTSMLRDIPLIRFTLSKETLASKDVNPDNANLFIDTTGFIARPPFKNQPIWISNPRFLDCDLTNIHVSIQPPADVNVNRENYQVALDVESITGQIFRANKRFQINTLLQSGQTAPASVKTTYYPIAWINLNSELPDAMTDKFKDRVQDPMKITEGASIAAMVGGCILLVVAVYFQVKNSNMHSPMPLDESGNLLQNQ